MGAPDTDNPRTFQLDFTYNRNEKDMSLNVISPFKTLDLHGMYNRLKAESHCSDNENDAKRVAPRKIRPRLFNYSCIFNACFRSCYWGPCDRA